MVGKRLGRRVLLDCLVQQGSGLYMRTSTLRTDQVHDDPAVQAAHATTTSQLPHFLDVQLRSHWAPICVGPCSQVNTLRSVVHFLAGQIGLEPSVDEAANDVDGTTSAVMAECGASPRCVGWGFVGASVIEHSICIGKHRSRRRL